MSYRKVDRALQRLGFEPVRQKGSHVRYKHGDGRAVTVPNHPGEAIGPGLLRKILRDANVTRDEFLHDS